MSKRKIGIFSGTFDPVHRGHIEACIVALGALDLDLVVIFIEKKPHKKQDVADFNHRLNMLKLAVKDYPGIRIADADSNNITTKYALNYLDSQFSGCEYWYIIGSDTLSHVEGWEDSDLLFSTMNICTVLRNNSEEKNTQKIVNYLKKHHPRTKFMVLPAVWSEVSSSKEKNSLRIGKEPEGLDQPVTDYINRHRLYES
jgi:nicotinate-nucleotide adenylyltransferase